MSDSRVSLRQRERHNNKAFFSKFPIHNLIKDLSNNKTWNIDNETAFFKGYERSYKQSRNAGQNTTKYYVTHEVILKTFCIFNKRTICAIERLARHKNPLRFLVNYAIQYEPLLARVMAAEDSRLMEEKMPERLERILGWVRDCKRTASI